MRYSCRAIIGHGQACEPNYQCDACAAKQKYIPRIEKLEADLETATMKRLLDSDRIEKLEAALRDIMNERGVCSTCGKLAEGNGSGVVYCDPPLFGIDQGCRWSAQDPIEIARKALEGKDD